MNIFVGNLSFDAKEEDVYKAFMAFGTVSSIKIVMEKKAEKSRGFGFVEMPNESEALAAIAGLHNKELIGRPLNVMPALPKKPKKEFAGKRNEHLQIATAESEEDLRQNNERNKDNWYKSDFQRTGAYKRGKRTRSFMKRRAEAGITEPMPERKYKDNPMRWRKKREQFKPWQKKQGESQPWRKAEGEFKPWRKNNEHQRQSRFKNRKRSVSHK